MTDALADSPLTGGARTGGALAGGTLTDSQTDTLVAVPGRGPVIPGHVSIAPRVLQKVGGKVVAEALAVDRRDVRVDARDDSGSLALRVATPITVPPLTAGLVAPVGGVLATVRSLQAEVTRRLFDITGRAVSRVDVTVTGSRVEKPGGLR